MFIEQHSELYKASSEDIQQLINWQLHPKQQITNKKQHMIGQGFLSYIGSSGNDRRSMVSANG